MIKKFMIRGIYGSSLMEERNIIDRFKYKGRGRPRNEDYITIEEAQKKLNRLRADYIEMQMP